MLHSGKILVVDNQTNQVEIWSSQKMEVIHRWENSNKERIMCAVGAKEFYFVGTDKNKVLVFDTQTNELVNTVLTRRTPISMTLLNKRVCVVGCADHAFTAINFKNNFKQTRMTWNMGNDWI